MKYLSFLNNIMNEIDYSLVGQVEEEISYKDLENLLNPQVMLHLWVKVKRGWTNNSLEMGQLGYD